MLEGSGYQLKKIISVQFKTKARAVDLLGKGQIADLPTAISELWKNGYDAYADKLQAYLYTEGYEDVKSPFLVLKDDGKGMSRQDIENKWLVLGTDSKSRNTPPERGPETLWKEPRPIMGEKGIGRLSVAYLGSPMLMLSKQIGSPLQVLYIDWRILENYDLLIDDVKIPIRSVTDLNSFQGVFSELKDEFTENFNDESYVNKYWGDQKELFQGIVRSTEQVELTNFFEDEVVKELIGSDNDTHGTHFVVFEPNEQLILLKKWIHQKNNADDQDVDSLDEIRTGLIGFFNDFKFDEDERPVKTKFLIKDETGERDFISSNLFFTKDDFQQADHSVEGEFDEYGTFNGKVRVYNETVDDYIFRPNRPANKKTKYGAFNIKFGYVPGRGNSMLDESQFNSMNERLQNFGGLYIYRDDLRVLPYGRPHLDFLGFEERRTKNAGAYFFSYRRLFGYVGLARKSNFDLKDKAGREGFINNAAFREFKTDLKAFFIGLAKEFYGRDAKQDLKQNQFDEFEKSKKLQEEEEKLVKQEKKEFRDQLKMLPSQLAKLNERFQVLRIEISKLLGQQDVVYHDLAQMLRKLEYLTHELNNLEPQKPKRFRMGTKDRDNYEDVKEKYQAYKCSINDVIAIKEDVLSRIEDEKLLDEFENKFKQYSEQLEELVSDSDSVLSDVFSSIKEQFNDLINQYTHDLNKFYNEIKPVSKKREDVRNAIEKLEDKFYALKSSLEEKLQLKSNVLSRLNFNIDEDALVGFYKSEYESALKQLNDFKSLAQLGIAVEIISHELNAMYSQLRSSIESMKGYLQGTDEASRHYKYLKNAFEHLDSKYRSLNPLYRGVRRTKTYVKGSDVKSYLLNFFEETLDDEKIKFESTVAFDNSEKYTFESVILPVYVNVINNAVYWLRSVNERKILLDYDEETESLLICNSGPKIRDSSLDEIFELFYSRRPKGRGLGLYLSRDILNTVGLNIRATNEPEFNELGGACFVIEDLNK